MGAVDRAVSHHAEQARGTDGRRRSWSVSRGREFEGPRLSGWPRVPGSSTGHALSVRHVETAPFAWLHTRKDAELWDGPPLSILRGFFLLCQRHLPAAAELGAELPIREIVRHFQEVTQPICSQRASRDVFLVTAPQLLAVGFLTWKPQLSA